MRPSPHPEVQKRGSCDPDVSIACQSRVQGSKATQRLPSCFQQPLQSLQDYIDCDCKTWKLWQPCSRLHRQYCRHGIADIVSMPSKPNNTTAVHFCTIRDGMLPNSKPTTLHSHYTVTTLPTLQTQTSCIEPTTTLLLNC